MIKKTTVAIDGDLLANAKAATGIATTRQVVDQALRRLVEASEAAVRDRVERQNEMFRTQHLRLDLEIYRSDEAWGDPTQ